MKNTNCPNCGDGRYFTDHWMGKQIRTCIECGEVYTEKDAIQKNYIKELEENLHQAKFEIRKLIDFIRNASPDICMCGSSMNNHSLTENHQAVSMYDYNVPQYCENAEKFLNSLDKA